MSLIEVTRESTLLREITTEWDFNYNGQQYTIREFDGLDGHQVWFNDEEIYDFDEEVLDGLTVYDILEEVKC
jgi:hypothetical protein